MNIKILKTNEMVDYLKVSRVSLRKIGVIKYKELGIKRLVLTPKIIRYVVIS